MSDHFPFYSMDDNTIGDTIEKYQRYQEEHSYSDLFYASKLFIDFFPETAKKKIEEHMNALCSGIYPYLRCDLDFQFPTPEKEPQNNDDKLRAELNLHNHYINRVCEELLPTPQFPLSESFYSIPGTKGTYVSRFLFSNLVVLGFLSKRLEITYQVPEENYCLEQGLIEALHIRIMEPEHYFEITDDTVREEILKEARHTQQELMIQLSQNKDNPLPGFLYCTQENWQQLMEELNLEFDQEEQRYIWSYKQWHARYFLDKLIKRGIIKRTKMGNYGKAFLSLFSCTWKDGDDTNTINHVLTRTENNPKHKNAEEKKVIDSAVEAVFPEKPLIKRF